MNSQTIRQTTARHTKTKGALPQSILRTVLEPLRRFRTWRDRRLAIRDLERLDDRLLADIGLDRGQIRFVIGGLAPRRGDLAPKGAASRARKIWTARAFLDAYNVPYETAPSKPQLTPADVAARARKFTVLVACWK